jgi:hypothetical protein
MLSNLDGKGRTVLFIRFQSALACLQESNGPSVSILRYHRSSTEERFALRIDCQVRFFWKKNWGRTYDVTFPKILMLSAACRGVRLIATGLYG